VRVCVPSYGEINHTHPLFFSYTSFALDFYVFVGFLEGGFWLKLESLPQMPCLRGSFLLDFVNPQSHQFPVLSSSFFLSISSPGSESPNSLSLSLCPSLSHSPILDHS